ncbi:MAG: response regulator transcription factor [Kiritimatiellae bacterium]|nr:response regulator transcription factor [Kiritimatiellia bacterium]
MSSKAGRKIRVMLADDHLVVRMGLAAIISIERDMELVGEAADGAEAVKLAAELHPDVVIMDIMMPKLDGVAATAEIRKRNPETQILILTTFGTSDDLRRALAVGAIGALVKDSAQTELVNAIRECAAGRKSISPAVERQLQYEMPKIELSPRQLEMLNYVAKGFNNAEIANMVGIGRDCVKAHLSAAFTRLDASSRSEAVAIAIRLGLLQR